MSKSNQEYLGEWIMGDEMKVKLYDDAIDFNFDFNFVDVNGISKIEERVESRMRKVVVEEIEKVCLDCGEDKLYDDFDGKFYCPGCWKND